MAPKQVGPLRAAIPCWIEDAENGLTGRFRASLQELWRALLLLNERLEALDVERGPESLRPERRALTWRAFAGYGIQPISVPAVISTKAWWKPPKPPTALPFPEKTGSASIRRSGQPLIAPADQSA